MLAGMNSEQVMVLLAAVSVLVAAIAALVAAQARRSAGASVAEVRTANDLAGKANRLSGESNEIAKAAVQQAAAAATDVAWDEMLAAVGMLQSFDAASSSQPVGTLLASVRIRAIQLVDRLPSDTFGEWVMREQRLGFALMREATVHGERHKPLTLDQVVAINSRFRSWVAGYTTNLRLFRTKGPLADVLQRLAELARESADDVVTRNGWEPLQDEIPGLSPLDPKE
ncbi:MAG: hypothetical protein QOJ79_642 [Actinomycetota bacterium]|jgi:hypothetical protein|nr:hypothetical protein [Actinomycetota bacterium]